MKFYSDIPDLHIIRQRLVGNRTEGYLLCKFDANGELESNDPEVIRQLQNIYRHDGTVEKAVNKTMKQCKKCKFECESQGDLLLHYRTNHKK